MSQALQLRKMSVAQIAVQNTLYQGRLSIAFRWLGEDWTCRLTHVRTVREREVRIVADWGGAEAVLLADLHWLESATQALLQESDVSALPVQLRLALLETAFAEIAGQLEGASKKPLRIKSLQLAGDQSGIEIDMYAWTGIGWKAECDSREFEGDLLLNATGLMFASAAARNREPDRYATSRRTADYSP